MQEQITPRVSIVTPYYNSGRNFEETYRCVINQTMREFEWIIMDDGSSRKEDIELLERLCCARGISGFEEAVREIILKEIRPYADCVEITPLGNILAFKKGKRRAKTKLMLNAHMDEVGMTVTYIEENGLLRFSTVGGIDRRVLCGKPVTVGEHIPGVIGAKPIHLLTSEEREKAVPVKDLYIDIGALTRQEAEAVVSPGDPVTFDSLFDTTHGMIKSRALDDRAGCVILIDLIKSLCPMTCCLHLSYKRKPD